MKRPTILASVCLCALAMAASAAAPLAEKLPAKTLVYAGWAGKTAAFDRSTLGQLTREPVADAIVKAIKQAARKNLRKEEHLGAFQNVWELASVAWTHPIALALVDFQPPKDGPPAVSAAVLIHVGPERAKFAKHLDALLELVKKDLPTAEAELPGGLKYRKLLIKDKDVPPVALGYLEDVFFLCLGQDMPAALVGVTPATSLKASADFKAQFAQVDGEGLLKAAYVNVAGILNRLEPMMGPVEEKPAPAAPGEEPARRREPSPRKIMAALGVDKVKALAASVREVDGKLHMKLKLFTPAPHRGPLMLFAGGKLSAADLASVPADATFFGAAKLSPQAVYNEIRRIARTVDPNAEEEFLEGINQFDQMFQVSLAKDLLPAMGDTWVLSSAPSQGGFLTGTVLTLTLKDAQKFAAVLDKVEAVLRKQMTPQERPAPPPGEAPPPGRRERPPAIESVKIDGVEIHYVRIPGKPIPVAPAWAVHKGKLYLAAWPQVLATTIQNEGKNPITKDPAFRALRKRMARGPSMLAYANLPQILRQVYGLALAGWTAGANMLQREVDIDVKPHWMPLLSKLEKYLSAGIGAVSAQDDGITFECYSSLPSPIVAAAPLAAALLPALGKARGKARTATSLANLNTLGKAIALYAADHEDKFPPDFAALVKAGSITPEALRSPHGKRAPPTFRDGKLIGEVDYIYIKHTIQSNGGLIMAYERPENHRGRGTCVLLVNNSVMWMDRPEFEELFAKTRRALGKKPRDDF